MGYKDHNLSWRHKYNPVWWFGNIDDPQPPDDYETDQPDWMRKIMWFCRNPFHNFTFYVLGIADKQFILVKGNCQGQHFVRNKVCKSWLYYNDKYYPYRSFWARGWRGYMGWRPSGAFGIKLQRAK